jgi:predicted peptidase
MKRLTLLACVLVFGGSTMLAQTNSADDMQKPKRFKQTTKKTLRADYLLYLPSGYNPKGSERWPLMLFLHGAGERGTNLAKVAIHGPPKMVRTRPDFPFILVSPQCPEGETWSNDVLLGLLDEVVSIHKVDTNRIYLTGLSMGGYATWSLATAAPGRFAAVAPICGGGETIRVLLASKENSAALKTLGVWAFHGAKDPVVPVEESERMVNVLKKVGAKDVKLTVYTEAQHDSWTEAYNNEALYKWFLEHTRASAK